MLLELPESRFPLHTFFFCFFPQSHLGGIFTCLQAQHSLRKTSEGFSPHPPPKSGKGTGSVISSIAK